LLSVARDQGFEFGAPSVIAVRGDRLALCRNDGRTPAGDENSALTLLQIHEQGRMTVTVTFAEGALNAAGEELDAWQGAGEGAEHADLVAAIAGWTGAMNRFDFDAIRELADPAFVYVDHREFGAATLDLDGFIEWQREYSDISYGTVIVDTR